MKIIANIVGLAAVALFVLSYQLKSRRNIVLVNALSRLLYVVQYVLLGALEGAALDTVGFFISLLCHRRNKGFVKKYLPAVILCSNALILAAGVLTYQNIVSVLAISGVFCEITALWLNRERNIRIFSLLAAPLWLIYNLINAAYGSALGNAITIVSILVALVRYDILKRARNVR